MGTKKQSKSKLAAKNRFKFSKETKVQFNIREEDIPANMKEGDEDPNFRDMMAENVMQT